MRLVSIAACGALALGCSYEVPQGPADPDRFGEFVEQGEDRGEIPFLPVTPSDEVKDEEGTPSTARVLDGALRGAFNNGVEVGGDATEIFTFESEGWNEVDVVRSEANGAAMGLLYLGANLDHPVLTDIGRVTTFTYGSNNDPVAGEDPIYIDVTACAGADTYNWDVDEPAGEVEVEVEEGPEPGDRIVTLRAEIGPDGTTGEMETQLLISH